MLGIYLEAQRPPRPAPCALQVLNGVRQGTLHPVWPIYVPPAYVRLGACPRGVYTWAEQLKTR